MDNLDFVDEISNPVEAEYLPGLPRQCMRCKVWSRFERPNKKSKCFTAKCPVCHAPIEIVVWMKNSRK